MKINWRRGINRIFALAVACWAAYVLWVGPGQREGRAFQDNLNSIPACVQTPAYYAAECVALANRTFENRLHSCSLAEALRDRHIAVVFAGATLSGVAVAAREPTPSRSLDWLGALIVLGIILLPPALAYGFVEIVWRTARWVLRGFRQPSG